MSIFHKIFGDPNVKEVKKLQVVIDKATALEPTMEALTDEGLKGKTAEFRTRLNAGETLDALLPEAFACVREAARRTAKLRHYDVQLIGGLVLHKGMIAEMRTGEGKTLVATSAAYLNALTEKGVHVVTVNDYLSRRDAVWMGQIHYALGLSVSCIQHAASFVYDPAFKHEPTHDEARDVVGSFRVDMDYLRPVSRREAYAADITYGTNNEFGFDYLRDNMATTKDQLVQRGLNFAIVDEVDSILIDEARTPLIISAPSQDPEDLYYRFAEISGKLIEKEDYQVDEKLKASTLTEAGIAKVERALGVENLYEGGTRLVHHMEQALKARALFKRDRDYVVKDGEVIIVDEFTGRLMQGRRYSEGLHQAIEAKERVQIQRESVTMATITFQNYFRLYEKLSGMTGTALTEAEEFFKIYKLDVLSIPTNKINRRVDLSDRLFKTELGKFKALAREVKERHAKGQPVLIGTVSIQKNEFLSELLKQEGVPHNVLNAKNHEREAEIIAQAGRKGAVTVATNMAGRGVDIILGGNPPDTAEGDIVREAGGLYVIGTERHESRRIDNQLRGRAGRQGDPGATQFFISTEDDLMRIFGSDRMRNMMERLHVPDDEAIENSVLTKMIEAAQQKVEGHNFDIRKHVLEYDDVLNKHRQTIYRKRRDILDRGEQAAKEGVRPLRAMAVETLEKEIERMVAFHTAAESTEQWEKTKLGESFQLLTGEEPDISSVWPEHREGGEEGEHLAVKRTEIIDALTKAVYARYEKLEAEVGNDVSMGEIERFVLLRSTDDLWIQHLETMEHLRRGVNLQAYGQRDPLVEYKREAYQLFQELLTNIQARAAQTLFRIKIAQQIVEESVTQGIAASPAVKLEGPAKE
jgi:preprotein translocase subunit SecA